MPSPQNPTSGTPQDPARKLFTMLPAAFTEHRWFSRRPYSRGHALADLACLAAWGEHDTSIGASRLHLMPGDIPASVRFLATRWGWSLAKVHEFISVLISDGLLVKIQDGKANGHPSVFRIVAPGLYGTAATSTMNGEPNGKANGERTVGEQSSRDVDVERRVNNPLAPLAHGAASTDQKPRGKWNRSPDEILEELLRREAGYPEPPYPAPPAPPKTPPAPKTKAPPGVLIEGVPLRPLEEVRAENAALQVTCSVCGRQYNLRNGCFHCRVSKIGQGAA